MATEQHPRMLNIILIHIVISCQRGPNPRRGYNYQSQANGCAANFTQMNFQGLMRWNMGLPKLFDITKYRQSKPFFFNLFRTPKHILLPRQTWTLWGRKLLFQLNQHELLGPDMVTNRSSPLVEVSDHHIVPSNPDPGDPGDLGDPGDPGDP